MFFQLQWNLSSLQSGNLTWEAARADFSSAAAGKVPKIDLFINASTVECLITSIVRNTIKQLKVVSERA